MTVFNATDFSQHEKVLYVFDHATDLRAIIAIHDTRLGPALGGCRAWEYESEAAALKDVLRLSRGMTYKAAMASLDLGGGKSVILLRPQQRKTPELVRAMGLAIESLGGNYIVGEDIGIGVDDISEMRRVTAHAAGAPKEMGGSGGPSTSTALGCYEGIRASARFHFGSEDLSGMVVAVQGVGKVGYALCQHLHAAGAELVVADVDPGAVRRAVEEFDANVVDCDAIISTKADVFTPCAFGGVINFRSLRGLRARIVAGAANNQLAADPIGDALRDRAILYAPDYVINGGGLIQLGVERCGYNVLEVDRRVRGIAATLTEVFEYARARNISTNRAADAIAHSRLAAAGKGIPPVLRSDKACR